VLKAVDRNLPSVIFYQTTNNEEFKVDNDHQTSCSWRLFFLGHSWVTATRNESKFGRSQANLDGEKINENARVSTEAI
jgi:hypothetical protein